MCQSMSQLWQSSLILALLRLNSACGGSLLIDGVDVARVPLERLRGAVSLIPQAPQLFSGSLRLNLDPLERHDGPPTA